MQTANDALNQGYRLNPNDPNSVSAAGNVAVSSSAPPYNPLVTHPDANITQFDAQGNPYVLSLRNFAISQQMNNAYSPSLVPNATQTYQPIQDSANQTLNYTGTPNLTTAPTSLSGTAQSGTAQGSASLANNPYFNPSSGYNATHATGVHGTIDPNSLIQNQFTQLMQNSDQNGNGVPDWAQNAVTAANQRMNALGLGASTMAGGATASAILNTALPMAQFNANVAATLNLQNLANDQQAMLSNASWDNAAKQFNTQSEQQNQQFFTSLISQIADQNANRLTTMSQFNVAQANQVGVANAAQANQVGMANSAQANALAQFNRNLDSQRQEFNAQNQLVVDQSNVQWRRTINTANTAGQNAVNQANVQNAFNMQQTDLNNIWQQARDEASWALTASENSQNRALSLVNSSLNRQTSLDIMNSQMQAAMFSQLGGFAVNLLGGLFGGSGASGIGSAIGSLFGVNSGGAGSAGGDSSGITSTTGDQTAFEPGG